MMRSSFIESITVHYSQVLYPDICISLQSSQFFHIVADSDILYACYRWDILSTAVQITSATNGSIQGYMT